ncbi:MAG: AAA family ATPase [Ignavibacteriaceae bacterium]|nr:AAA family ATPase [Ignavibacteriaceae bacterium]
MKQENEGPDTQLMDEALEAFKMKEYWYCGWAIRKILQDQSLVTIHKKAKLLELETMIALFQLRTAILKAQSYKDEFEGEEKFTAIYNKLINLENRQSSVKDTEETLPAPPKSENVKSLNLASQTNEDERPAREEPKNLKIIDLRKLDSDSAPAASAQDMRSGKSSILTLKKRTDFERGDSAIVTALYAKMFDMSRDLQTGERIYMLQFAENRAQYIGVEVIILNPYYNVKDAVLNGTAVWYMGNEEAGHHDFEVAVDREWKNIVFVESWGTDSPGYWQRGQARVEIYLHDQKVCERWFLVGISDIPNTEEIDVNQIEAELAKKASVHKTGEKPKDSPAVPEGEESLVDLLAQLDSFTGLKSVKQSMRDFVDYLEFIRERKKSGLKTAGNLSVNSVFLGNPGTGKTTIARVLGKIFKAMGILEKGHIIEVDRGALVGQYIGETAQKTEKIIEDSMGGLLFIDEAYTLVKKGGGGQDFGQEAIDTLLKKMEDKAGQFAVIAAGYPDEMNDFLSSNPGMKSRFTHFFDFEDYNPDELIEIFKIMAEKEEYSVELGAVDLLKKHFTNLYRKRDKTFGNARLVRNSFNDAKMALSKRYLKLPEKLRDKSALTTIKEEDIAEILKHTAKTEVKAGVDEENLTKYLAQLNGLTGLPTVKKEINELVKLARYYVEQGESIQSRFADHILFLGNPGTGKTTVARIVSQIFSALGLLPKGHLIEADRQQLVASYVGKTAEKTTELINQSMGGTLFIDEAYTLVKGGENDFGKEAIDTLLKRMEDDRGKFICIAAGYTDDMRKFLDSNPGLQSRFTKQILFEDYAPDELMEIARSIFKSKGLTMSPEAEEAVKIHFNELYRQRDKNFGNARLVRNLVDSTARNHLLRVADIPKDERTPENTSVVLPADISGIGKNKPEEKKVVAVEGNKELLEKHLAELNELTGLDSVKKSVDKLISGLKVAKMREARGLTVLRKNLHAAFLGNPGTGKTTVARLLSKVYKEMGLLEKGHLVEVDRAALVAGYQGQTSAKTEEVIQKALGGTLFIDEAYTLARGGNDFGQEAIDTLLKRMEDFKDSLVVIVAGYTNEMQEFLDANPGMRSRFTNFFEFEDYDPKQMLNIATSIAVKSGYKLDEGASRSLLVYFTMLYNARDKNFGNARTVRNVLYKAISNQEERILTVSNLTDQDLITITSEDVRVIEG